MMDAEKTQGMKSAYELALEQLDRDGIERPRKDGLEPEIRDEIAEIRSRTAASTWHINRLDAQFLKHLNS